MTFEVSVGTGYTLGPFRRDFSRRLARAAARATDKAALYGRDTMRADMRSKRLGGLANVVSYTSDLKKGRVPDGDGPFDIAGFVTIKGIRSPRTAGALKAYINDDTTEIAPKKGRWMAIPTKEIPRRAGRRKMTPELYRSTGLEQRIGPLTFVPGKHGGVAYLVVQDASISLAKTGKARRLPKRGSVRSGRARVGFVAFVLIRIMRRARRVDPRRIGEQAQRQLPRLLAREFDGSYRAPSVGTPISHSIRI